MQMMLFHHIFSILAAVMLGLLRLVSALASSMKLASYLWSSGRQWLLQYEQLYPKTLTLFLQRKHRYRSTCFGCDTSFTIGYYLATDLSGGGVACSRPSTCSGSWATDELLALDASATKAIARIPQSDKSTVLGLSGRENRRKGSR